MTKEDLDKKLLKLKEQKNKLEEQMIMYINNGNIDYSIVNMIDIDEKIKIIDDKINNTNYYLFGQEYISYILSVINSVENIEKLDEVYEVVDFSNQKINSHMKNRDNFHVVTLIAQHEDIERVKKDYFKQLYQSKLGTDEYDLMLIPLINSINGLIINLRTLPKYVYASDKFERNASDLLYIKEVFAEKFPYITEFLEILFNYRLDHEQKDIDEDFILNAMNNIINKYNNKPKVKEKH